LLSGRDTQLWHCGVQENHDTCEEPLMPEVTGRSSIQQGSKVGIIENNGMQAINAK
jgi:hypothetical protein